MQLESASDAEELAPDLLLSQVSDALGSEALGFILGIPRAWPGKGLTAGQLRALHLLSSLTREAEEVGQPGPSLLGLMTPDPRISLVDQLRLLAGAHQLVTPAPADRTTTPLMAMIPTAYARLISYQHGLAYPGPPSLHLASAYEQEFQSEVLQDEDLKTFFSVDSGESTGWTAPYIAPGSSSSLQLWGLSSVLYLSGWGMAKIDSAAPTLEQFAAAVVAQLDRLRALARGETVRVPLLVGFTGVRLPDRSDGFACGQVSVRPMRPSDSWWQPNVQSGSVWGTDERGQDVEVHFAGDVFMKMEVEFRIELRELRQGEDWPRDLAAMHQTAFSGVDSVRLALALATDYENPALVLTSWQTMITPLSSVNPYSIRSQWGSSRLRV